MPNQKRFLALTAIMLIAEVYLSASLFFAGNLERGLLSLFWILITIYIALKWMWLDKVDQLTQMER